MLISYALKHLIQVVFASTIASSYPSLKTEYNVISLVSPNQTLGVLVDNQLYVLNSSEKSSLLYSGKAPVAHDSYKYVVLDINNNGIIQQENFTRSPVIENSTYYEHYNRTWNILNLDPLPTIMDPLPIINRVKKDAHFDGQIPTIHIRTNQSLIDYIHKNPREDLTITSNLTYISPTKIKNFENIEFSISGHSTRSLPKLSYRFTLNKKHQLYGYRRYKLRSMSTDPSYMRDQLAYDIANRMGMPTSKSSYARVYINNRAIGLFGLTEVFKGPWVENEFYKGLKKPKHGALYVVNLSDGRILENIIKSPNGPEGIKGLKNPRGPAGPGGSARKSLTDLSYLGGNLSHYRIVYPPKQNPTLGTANFTRIMDLTKFLSEQPSYGLADNSTVSLWEKKIDVESLLRGLAHEIVISNSDGYFTMANNYILYDDIENERIVFSSQDFDLTMGSMMFNETHMNGGNYTEFPGLLVRPLSSKLLSIPQFKENFEKKIIYITKNLVNINVLAPRINQLSGMLLEDVAWDKSLPRVSSGSRRPTGLGEPIEHITFSDAVNGTIYHDTLNINRLTISLKAWIKYRSENLLSFFNETI